MILPMPSIFGVSLPLRPRGVASAFVAARWLLVFSALLLASTPFSWCLPPTAPSATDTLTFANGDTLTGSLEREVSGNVFFKSAELGEITVPWSKIRSLHTQAGYVVLENQPGVHIRHFVADARHGSLTINNGVITINPVVPAPAVAIATSQIASVPVKNAQFILDEATFDRQVRHAPNFFEGWNGSATVGVTLVRGTQNQYTYTSAVTLARTVPTVAWLATRNRTTADFSSSYGRITQPAYVSAGVLVPATYTETSIFHADAERDEYISRRFFALAQTAFDHNFSQGLGLQETYGAGFGVTVIKRAAQTLDLKAALQYEKQSFLTTASGTSQNLVGSTLSGTYFLKLPRGLIFNQQIAYLPAFNVTRAYSANETDTLTFPFLKSVAFTIGTIDSYLNDPLPAEPPTTRNSLQFTSGITYTMKSKY